MKILLISPFIPYPLNSGGNQAVFSMIDNLRKKHSVSMLLQARRDSEDVKALRELWPDVRFFIYGGRAGKKRFLSLKQRVISYFAGSFARKYNRFFFRFWPKNPDMESMLRVRTLINLRPIELDYGYCEFVREVSGQGFDVVQVEFNGLIDLCYYLPDDVVKVFVHHEIGFVRRENELSLLESPAFEDLAHYRQEKDMEISALRRYDHIVTLTDTDKTILSGYIPEDRIYVSPAVVKQEKSRPFRECGREFVFVGGSDHFPNYDGMNNPDVKSNLLKGISTYIFGHEYCDFTDIIQEFYYVSPYDLCILLESLECDEIITSQYLGSSSIILQVLFNCSQAINVEPLPPEQI